jgi:hypothetical protein
MREEAAHCSERVRAISIMKIGMKNGAGASTEYREHLLPQISLGTQIKGYRKSASSRKFRGKREKKTAELFARL